MLYNFQMASNVKVRKVNTTSLIFRGIMFIANTHAGDIYNIFKKNNPEHGLQLSINETRYQMKPSSVYEMDINCI